MAIVLAQLCPQALRPWLFEQALWTRGVIVSIGIASVFSPMVRLFHDLVVPGPVVRTVPLMTLWVVCLLSSIGNPRSRP